MVLRLLALQLHALGAELGEHAINALLFNRAQAGGRNAQRYPALFGLDPETLCMQVGQEATTPLVVRVRDAITDCRPLAGDLADAGHTINLENSVTYDWRSTTFAGLAGLTESGFIPAPAPRDKTLTAARARKRSSTSRPPQ